MRLFRQEAVEAQRMRLFGDVAIYRPLGLDILCFMAVAVTAAIWLWLSLATYARKENASGWITPSGGVAQVYSGNAGVIAQTFGTVGQHVRKGQPLAAISFDETNAEGSLVRQQREQTSSRLAELDFQLLQLAEKSRNDLHRVKAQAASTRAEAEHIEEEIRFSSQQLAILKVRLATYTKLAEHGDMSRAEMERVLQQVLAQEQSSAELRRQWREKIGQARDLEASELDIPRNAEAEASQIRVTKSTLQQSLAELGVRNSLFVTSPITGSITAVNAKTGDAVTTATPLFAIAPDNSKLEVELLVPTKGIGFLAVNQQVRISVDAFPSERFGILEGKVAIVSRSPINPGQLVLPISFNAPVYRVTIQLDHSAAFSKAHLLRPGMTVTAFVTTARLSFLEWLLEPLLAEK